MLFVVTDDVDETRDRQIADHVLRMHRYLPPGVEEGTPVIDSLTQQLSVENTATQTNGQTEEADASPFEKFDPLLHFGFTDEAKRMQQGNGVATRTRRKKKESKVEILSISFVKKYLQYATHQMETELCLDQTIKLSAFGML